MWVAMPLSPWIISVHQEGSKGQQPRSKVDPSSDRHGHFDVLHSGIAKSRGARQRLDKWSYYLQKQKDFSPSRSSLTPLLLDISPLYIGFDSREETRRILMKTLFEI